MLKFLEGKKTYVVGVLTILLGGLKLILPELPVEGDASHLIATGFGFITLRAGVEKNK